MRVLAMRSLVQTSLRPVLVIYIYIYIYIYIPLARRDPLGWVFPNWTSPSNRVNRPPLHHRPNVGPSPWCPALKPERPWALGGDPTPTGLPQHPETRCEDGRSHRHPDGGSSLDHPGSSARPPHGGISWYIDHSSACTLNRWINPPDAPPSADGIPTCGSERDDCCGFSPARDSLLTLFSPLSCPILTPCSL